MDAQLGEASARIHSSVVTHQPGETPAARPPMSSGRYDSDLLLARDSLAGSLTARREFVERMKCVPKFLAVLNSRRGRPFSDHDLEDIVQETLVEIWRRLDSYAGLASLQTWAYRFCQHVLSSRLRSAHRLEGRIIHLETGERESPCTTSLDYEYVYRALEKVDDMDARIVRHKHFDHLTFEEIGQRLAMSQSSAKANYHRALARLRDILDPLRREAGL